MTEPTPTLRSGDGAPLPFERVGTDLQRPECVLATASGSLHMSDHRGGIMTLRPDGSQSLLGRSELVPNGIALQPDGSFLVANLGAAGGVWHIDAQGAVRPWLMEVDGVPLPRVNFVTTEADGRTWICVSGRETGDRYPTGSATGFVLLHDRHGVRCVADGLHYTNELRLSADGAFAYVNETFGRCTSRLRVAADGRLVERATIAEFEAGDFPDGLTLDVEGGVWVVCVGSNRLYRIDAQGRRSTVIDDAVPQCVAQLEQALQAGELTRPMLGAARGHHLSNITSIAFGGADRRTAYLGSLSGSALVRFRAPVAGLQPAWWHWG